MWRNRTYGPLIGGLIAGLLSLTAPVQAHEHHQHGPADESIPIDSLLWLHIIVQSTAWFFLFPLSMVLGLTRHRLHVPLAVLALLLTSSGYVMGHKHGGRSFPHTAHGTLASVLLPLLFAQGTLGTYLKLHLKWKGETSVRPFILFFHGLIGKLFSILGWAQMVLGIITLRSWCFGSHTGQCLAHHIMGSAFIAYGSILLIMMKAGVNWLSRRKNTSQEFLDSSVIFAWGCVNALTEHHGGPWTHKDLQHTMLGVVWVAGGLAGMWTSRGGRRSVIPALVIILTGWAMSGHAQALMISTMIHALFGYCLMAAGLARIIEVCFVLKDAHTGQNETQNANHTAEEEQHRLDTSPQWFPIRAFQYLPSWLLFASGVLFMSATDEELRWADSLGVDHITWGLIDFSVSFFLFFWANFLIDFYTSQGGRFGSARKTQSGNQPGVLESARSGASDIYSRLSVGENAPLRMGDGEGSGSGSGSGSSDSLEMNRLEGKKGRSRRSANGDHFRDDNEQGAHVLFDEGEEDEEEDPFDDDTRH